MLGRIGNSDVFQRWLSIPSQAALLPSRRISLKPGKGGWLSAESKGPGYSAPVYAAPYRARPSTTVRNAEDRSRSIQDPCLCDLGARRSRIGPMAAPAHLVSKPMGFYCCFCQREIGHRVL